MSTSSIVSGNTPRGGGGNYGSRSSQGYYHNGGGLGGQPASQQSPFSTSGGAPPSGGGGGGNRQQLVSASAASSLVADGGSAAFIPPPRRSLFDDANDSSTTGNSAATGCNAVTRSPSAKQLEINNRRQQQMQEEEQAQHLQQELVEVDGGPGVGRVRVSRATARALKDLEENTSLALQTTTAATRDDDLDSATSVIGGLGVDVRVDSFGRSISNLTSSQLRGGGGDPRQQPQPQQSAGGGAAAAAVCVGGGLQRVASSSLLSTPFKVINEGTHSLKFRVTPAGTVPAPTVYRNPAIVAAEQEAAAAAEEEERLRKERERQFYDPYAPASPPAGSGAGASPASPSSPSGDYANSSSSATRRSFPTFVSASKPGSGRLGGRSGGGDNFVRDAKADAIFREHGFLMSHSGAAGGGGTGNDHHRQHGAFEGSSALIHRQQQNNQSGGTPGPKYVPFAVRKLGHDEIRWTPYESTDTTKNKRLFDEEITTATVVEAIAPVPARKNQQQQGGMSSGTSTSHLGGAAAATSSNRSHQEPSDRAQQLAEYDNVIAARTPLDRLVAYDDAEAFGMQTRRAKNGLLIEELLSDTTHGTPESSPMQHPSLHRSDITSNNGIRSICGGGGVAAMCVVGFDTYLFAASRKYALLFDQRHCQWRRVDFSSSAASGGGASATSTPHLGPHEGGEAAAVIGGGDFSFPHAPVPTCSSSSSSSSPSLLVPCAPHKCIFTVDAEANYLFALDLQEKVWHRSQILNFNDDDGAQTAHPQERRNVYNNKNKKKTLRGEAIELLHFVNESTLYVSTRSTHALINVTRTIEALQAVRRGIQALQATATTVAAAAAVATSSPSSSAEGGLGAAFVAEGKPFRTKPSEETLTAIYAVPGLAMSHHQNHCWLHLYVPKAQKFLPMRRVDGLVDPLVVFHAADGGPFLQFHKAIDKTGGSTGEGSSRKAAKQQATTATGDSSSSSGMLETLQREKTRLNSSSASAGAEGMTGANTAGTSATAAATTGPNGAAHDGDDEGEALNRVRAELRRGEHLGTLTVFQETAGPERIISRRRRQQEEEATIRSPSNMSASSLSSANYNSSFRGLSARTERIPVVSVTHHVEIFKPDYTRMQQLQQEEEELQRRKEKQIGMRTLTETCRPNSSSMALLTASSSSSSTSPGGILGKKKGGSSTITDRSFPSGNGNGDDADDVSSLLSDIAPNFMRRSPTTGRQSDYYERRAMNEEEIQTERHHLRRDHEERLFGFAPFLDESSLVVRKEGEQHSSGASSSGTAGGGTAASASTKKNVSHPSEGIFICARRSDLAAMSPLQNRCVQVMASDWVLHVVVEVGRQRKLLEMMMDGADDDGNRRAGTAAAATHSQWW